MIKKRWFIVLIILLFGCNDEAALDPAIAEKGFIKIFTDDNLNTGEVIKVLTDGYIIMGNSVDGANFSKTKLIRLDENGNKLWEETYDVDGTDQLKGKSMDVTFDEMGYIIIGDRINSVNNTSSMYLLKVDNNGNVVSTFDISPEELSDGTTNFTGETYGIDVFVTAENTVLSLAQTGTVTSGTETIENAILTAERSINDFTLACNKPKFDKGQNITLVKSLYRASGESSINIGGVKQGKGANTANYPNVCYNQTLSQFLPVPALTDPQANQFIPFRNNLAMVGTDEDKIYVSVVSDAGTDLGTKIYTDDFIGSTAGGKSIDEGLSIAATSDGGFIITGSTRITSGTADEIGNEKDAIAIKTNGYGKIEWFKKFGNTNQEEGVYVQETSDGGFAILTNIEYGGIKMMALIKTDKYGELD